MRGLMQDHPLLISSLLEHAVNNHSFGQIVSKLPTGEIHRYTYEEANRRAKALASFLISEGITQGESIGTIAWNTHRHFELYFGVSGIGSVLHTINPRLSLEHLSYVINHGEDRLLFIDNTFVPQIEAIWNKLEKVEKLIVLDKVENIPSTSLPVISYEEILSDSKPIQNWPRFDEHLASSLCYTSGTTGKPKGVLYSHRSTVLHAMATAMGDGYGVSSRETIFPIVPMFHANAWGLCYGAAMTGANLVLPGPFHSGEDLVSMMIGEKVSMAAGVPVVWNEVLKYLKKTGETLPHLNKALIGGTPCPEPLILSLEKNYGVEVLHSWGMTETSPMGTIARLSPSQSKEDFEIQLPHKLKQGRPVYGVEIKITDEENNDLAKDGKSSGLLKVRGPWITKKYFKQENNNVDKDGWFATGDVALIDELNEMQITDRAKDVIKSGGEWISSVELESQALNFPGVEEAAVIGVPHPRWEERPLLIVKKETDSDFDLDDIKSYYKNKVAKWWIPEGVVELDDFPKTSTGKIKKDSLRESFKDFYRS